MSVLSSWVKIDLSMCHVQVVNVILLMILSIMLVFEDFSQNAFTVTIYLIALKRHSSAMNSIELTLCSSWWSLTTISISLCDRWSLYFNCLSWSRDKILCLVTTWLNHQSLILLNHDITICINGLPCCLRLIGWIWIDSLVHSIHYVSRMSLSSWWSLCCLIY